MSSQAATGLMPAAPAPPRRHYDTTTKRTLTRRGVMWIGQTCNLRCYFCYFLNRIEDAQHPEHPFMELDKLKAMCHTLRYFYGNNAVDIQGGEPTIYPDILELIRYCNEIGLYPTLITNGWALAKKEKLQQFKDAGIRDFLVSLHGIGPIHDEVVCRKGAYDKITQAIENMVELDVSFRFNCTMSKPVVPILPDIARKAVNYGANAVNYIAFNPFEDQETGIRTHDNVAQYSAIKTKLGEAMDILEDAGIECNVRYLPLCMAEERHRKNFYNFQQLPYDHHEWDYQSWMWTGLQPQRIKAGPLLPPFRIGPYANRVFRTADVHQIVRNFEERPLRGKVRFGGQRAIARVAQIVRGKDHYYREEAIERAAVDCKYQYHDECGRCAMRNICDGFHGDYADLYGTSEARAIDPGQPAVSDPLHYIRHQEKIVEPEDTSWAL